MKYKNTLTVSVPVPMPRGPAVLVGPGEEVLANRELVKSLVETGVLEPVLAKKSKKD